MAVIGAGLLIVFLIGAALGIYALVAPRRTRARSGTAAREPLQADTGWTNAAGEEFAGLNEAARCDLIFAVAALDDDRSAQLLAHALDDPSEAVALAAAHALRSRNRVDAVEAYLAARPGERSDRIAQTLALLT